MEKYKFRSYVYGTFLITTIVILILFGYLLVVESNKPVSDTVKQDILNKADIHYQDSYLTDIKNNISNTKGMISDMFGYNSFNCRSINMGLLYNHLTEEKINELKSNIVVKNEVECDCNNVITNKLKSISDFNVDNIKVVSYDYENKTLVVTDGIYLISNKYVDNVWLIDLF